MKNSQIFILVGVAFLLVGIIILEPVISGGLVTPSKYLENKAYLGGILSGIGIIVFLSGLFTSLSESDEQKKANGKNDVAKV